MQNGTYRCAFFLACAVSSKARTVCMYIHSPVCSGWHLDHVEVVDEATGVDYFFPCGMWLDKKEGDGKIERDLPVTLRDLNAVKCMYKVTVYTSDLKFAGTDANVFVEMLGERCVGGQRLLHCWQVHRVAGLAWILVLLGGTLLIR